MNYFFFILQHVRISLQDATVMLYLFCLDFSVLDTNKLLPHLAHSTVVNFFSKLREKLYDIVDDMQFDKSNDVIEIDESLFGKKRKNNKGSDTKRLWIFGMIQRGTRKSYFVPVELRNKETLIPIIKSKVKCGSTIYHDDWPAYRTLSDEGYKTGVINHSKEFVSKKGVSTNTIEGIIMSLYIF